MELKNYTLEQQKSIVNYWSYYYGKGIRTLQDFENVCEEYQTKRTK